MSIDTYDSYLQSNLPREYYIHPLSKDFHIILESKNKQVRAPMHHIPLIPSPWFLAGAPAPEPH